MSHQLTLYKALESRYQLLKDKVSDGSAYTEIMVDLAHAKLLPKIEELSSVALEEVENELEQFLLIFDGEEDALSEIIESQKKSAIANTKKEADEDLELVVNVCGEEPYPEVWPLTKRDFHSRSKDQLTELMEFYFIGQTPGTADISTGEKLVMLQQIVGLQPLDQA